MKVHPALRRLTILPAPAFALLAMLPWLIQPGQIQPDTKVDLLLSPGRYLERSLTALSTHSGFGELQNQAYGYLFPMGPTFWLGDVLGLPAWATQRVWWDLLLLTAGVGAYLVARRIVSLTVPAALLVAALYALSPRVLTLLSQLSVEAWPGAVMPWLILALWRHAQGFTTRGRFVVEIAALSAALGGVNATVSLCALLGAGVVSLFLRSWRTVALFVLGAALGSAWWLGPLLVLGKYAYPFMDYIETSRITTAVTSVPGVLRGANDWVAYILDAESHPVWQGGWVQAQARTAIIAGCLIAGLGLYGLLRLPNRRLAWALATLLTVGLLGMAAPHGGTFGGGFSEQSRAFLDGPGAPLRNVHKLDPLVRLPLALGLGYAVMRARRTIKFPIVLVALIGMTAVWQGRVGDANPVAAYPVSLRATAHNIDERAATNGGVTLVLPSARTASYAWGNNTDEPLTALASSPVAVRASAPLVAPGAQRIMDAVDEAVMRGDNMSAVATSLRRMNVSRVVIRHGLTTATQTASPQLYVLHLAQATGDFTQHRVFGAGQERFDVFDVARPTNSTLSTGPRVAVLGAPESTLTLAAIGVDPRSQYVLGSSGGWITDDARRQVYNNGRPAPLALGPTTTANDADVERIGAKPLTYPGWQQSQSVRTFWGVDDVSATDSLADPFAPDYRGPGAGPGSALDGSEETAWLTRADHPGALTLRWKQGNRNDLPLSIRLRGVSAKRGVLSVSADGKTLATTPGETVSVTIPAGTHAATFTLTDRLEGAHADAVGIAEITSTSDLGTAVRVPGTFDPAVNGLVLTAQRPVAQGKPLLSEDGERWTREVRVAQRGTVNVSLRDAQNRCTTATLRIRDESGAWGSATQNPCNSALNLSAGLIQLRVDGKTATRLIITPTGSAARTHLGLGGAADGATVTALRLGENAGWKAPVAGQRTVVDGWREAIQPTDPAASAQWRFSPQRSHVTTLALGGCIAVGAVIAAVLPWGSRRVMTTEKLDNFPPPRSLPWALMAVMEIALGFLLAGWAGAIVAAIAMLAVVVMTRRSARSHAIVAVPVSVTATGPLLAYLGVVASSSVGARVSQLLATAAVCAFVALTFGPTESPVSPRRATSATPGAEKSS